MDKLTSQALLTHQTAQTELLLIICRYFVGLLDSKRFEAIADGLEAELESINPEVAQIRARLRGDEG